MFVLRNESNNHNQFAISRTLPEIPGVLAIRRREERPGFHTRTELQNNDPPGYIRAFQHDRAFRPGCQLPVELFNNLRRSYQTVLVLSLFVISPVF